MKKFLMVILVLAVAAVAMAQNVSILHTGDTKIGDSTLFTIASERVMKDYPKAKLEFLKVDLADGSTLTMDAMLAAGTPPNVYIDTMVRTSKYMVPEFAAPLQGLLRDVGKYQNGILDPYMRGKDLLGLPSPGGAQGMCINLDIMDEIGYKVPANWTIDDFLKMAELVKQKYGGKKWATGMFAANQSGDYLINNWYASFGIPNFYSDNSYNTAIVAKNGGKKVYEFYLLLDSKGYIPPSSATLNDDDYAAQWYRGQLAATAFFPNWTKGYFDTAASEGLKPFRYSFVPFPRAAGVKKVPTYFSNGVMLVHKTGTEADKVAARFIEYVNSADLQEQLAVAGAVIPNRIDAAGPTDPHVQEVAQIVKDNGIMDVGLTDPRFTERRALQFPILQMVLNRKKAPDAAIKEYEGKLSAVRL